MTRSEINAFFDTLPPNALYGLCDRALLDAFDLSLQQYAEHCRRENVSLVQYRNKHDDPEHVASELKTLRDCWDGVLIINDRWQLHALCDGVHIGQDDLAAFGPDAPAAAAQLRREVGDACILGLSTHNAEEIAMADTLPIDYIGLGAFRATDTKNDAAVLGDALDVLAAASLHPVAAIGGVTYDDRFEHARMRVMGSAFFKGAAAWK